MSAELTGISSSLSNGRLRLDTLVKIRWLAILGQFAAVIVVWLFLQFDFSPLSCLFLIGASVILNIALKLKYPTTLRLTVRASTMLLSYDIVQLAALLFLTGGLQNPFAFLLTVPVVISATVLTVNYTLFLGGLTFLCTSLLAFFYYPLPWVEGEILQLPNAYIAGMWIAILASIGFTAFYVFRVADEARKLSDALTATELVLQSEQHLSNLDGLAAAAAHELGTPLATIALVSKEMIRELNEESAIYDDAKLLRSQAERCREILQKLSSLSSEGDRHIGEMPFSSIMEEVSAPHRDFGVEVNLEFPKDGNEPICFRNPAILYGLGNLIENAVDYAESTVSFEASWDENLVNVFIRDDGKGYSEELMPRIGEPYVTQRNVQDKSGGLGLGLFIAKTLLERSGATLLFSNAQDKVFSGATIHIQWPREMLELQPKQFENAEI